MIRKAFALLFLLLKGSLLYGQFDIAVGTWRTHNSYNSLVSITSSDSKLYAASTNALFSFDENTEEINTITSLSGLNDFGITVIDFNESKQKLVIAYKNGNIDIIKNNKIANFPDLLTASISTSKEIHHIYNYQDQAYLSADFGVMVVDLSKMQVKDTFFELGPMGQEIKVYASTIYSDTLYIATEIGIMRGSLLDNLKDFNQWQLFGPVDGVPNSLAKIIVSTPTGVISAIDNTGIFELKENVWTNTGLLTSSEFNHGNQGTNSTLITTTDSVYVYTSATVLPIQTTIGEQPVAAITFNNQNWIADSRNGLVNTALDNSIYPSGPYVNDVVQLYNYENNIIGFPTAYNNSFQPLRNDDGYFLFSDGSWENFNSTGYPSTTLTPKFDDITGVAYTSSDKTLYFSSFGYGVMSWNKENTQFDIIDESNSPLFNSNPPGKNVLVSALGSSKNELAVLNYNSSEALLTLNSGVWQTYNPSLPSANATQIINMGNGTYWMKIASSSGGGIKVFDAINNRELYLTTATDSGNLPDNNVFDLSLDREGKMWVATEKGVVYYQNAAFIFELGIIDPVLPIFDSQILFRNEKITALDIDGGNRIWMATSSGLWLFANDGQEEVLHFEAGESPLPSNDIIDLAINQENGEVFIATANGLVSFRGTSTSAGKLEEVKIFPNPVLAAKNDIVTFEGVPDNANLKITDASGRLIYQTQANGNTAVWQGLSSASPNLSSGVYFVYIANEDGTETQVGRIAIIF